MSTEQLELARAKRDEAIAVAASNAGKQWQNEAVEVTRMYLTEHPTMKVDDLWDYGLPPMEVGSKRALGAVIKIALKNGWIEEIVDDNGYIAAYRSERGHTQVKQVWQSCLYSGTPISVDDWFDRLP